MKVKLSIKVLKWVKSLIGLEINDTETGQGSECHLTFLRGRVYIAK